MQRAYPRYADRLKLYNVTFFTKHLWRSHTRITSKQNILKINDHSAFT